MCLSKEEISQTVLVLLPSLLVTTPSAVEVLLVHTVTLGALQIVDVVSAQDRVVRQVVLSLDSEKHFAAQR